MEAYTVKRFMVDIYDRRDHRLLTCEFPASLPEPYLINTQPGTSVQGTVLYYPPDLATLTVVLTLTANNQMVGLFAKAGKNSTLNERFDLRAIYIK